MRHQPACDALALPRALPSARADSLSILAILIARYIHKHPELCIHAMPESTYRAARFRVSGLIFISVVAVVIAIVFPGSGAGNMAFMLMMVIMPMSRRIEARSAALPAKGDQSNFLNT